MEDNEKSSLSEGEKFLIGFLAFIVAAVIAWILIWEWINPYDCDDYNAITALFGDESYCRTYSMFLLIMSLLAIMILFHLILLFWYLITPGKARSYLEIGTIKITIIEEDEEGEEEGRRRRRRR